MLLALYRTIYFLLYLLNASSPLVFCTEGRHPKSDCCVGFLRSRNLNPIESMGSARTALSLLQKLSSSNKAILQQANQICQ